MLPHIFLIATHFAPPSVPLLLRRGVLPLAYSYCTHVRAECCVLCLTVPGQQFLDFRASQWPLYGMGCTALVLADPSVHRCIGEGPLRRGHDCHSDGHTLGLLLGFRHG